MPDLHAGTADILEAHRVLEDRYGYPFDSLRAIFPHVPLCAHGAEHRDVRRRMAIVLAERRGAVLTRVDAVIEEAVRGLVPGAQVELMETVVVPLVRSVLSTLAGVRFDDETSLNSVSTIFDRMIGFRRRQKADQALQTARMKMRDDPDWQKTEDDENVLLALFVLGNDLLGSCLGASLYQIFRQNPGRRFSEIAYPAIPNEAGVPYVERIAESPFEYDGIQFAAGARLRVYLHSFAYSDDGDRGRMFGAGPHTCLGKQLSLDIWRRLTAALERLEARVEVLEYAVRTEDYLFNFPSWIVIKIWE